VIVTRLSDDTFATLLLCGGLGGKQNPTAPLTRKEWNSLVRSLIRANWRPGDVMRWGIDAAQAALGLEEETTARLGALLSQSLLVASEVERLAGAGVGIISRADESYPSRWKARLREQSPPLLFVAGPVASLERGGIAAVGSRDVDENGTAFAQSVGRAAARARTPLISGGARGVDREAMFGALDAGGEAIGILPDGLSRTLRSPDIRRWVAEGQLVLVSPHRPDAGFHIGNAMSRNKLIYALADVSIVVSSDAGRGGTWAGATENLRNDWSPLFVRAEEGAPEGNRRLIDLDGLPLAQADIDIETTGGLLLRLLDRASQESVVAHSRLNQQPLHAGHNVANTSSSAGPHGSAPTHHEVTLASARNPDQLELL